MVYNFSCQICFFIFNTLRVLFAFWQQDGAVPRKLKNIITSNHKMPMSTNSVNFCVYNKPTYIEQAIVLPLIQTFLCTNPPRQKAMKNSEYKRGLTIIHLVSRASDQTKKSDEHRVTGSSDFFFCHPKSPLTQALTQILFVPERLWILFCFWMSIMRKGQSLSFCGRRVRLP